MGRKLDKRDSTLVAVKVFEFFNVFFFLFFSSLLMAMYIVPAGHVMLKIPQVKYVIGFGMVVFPLLCRTIAYLIVIIGFSEKNGWFGWIVFAFIIWAPILGVYISKNKDRIKEAVAVMQG